MGIISNKIPWDLRRRGEQDSKRHQQKIKQAIKDNLENIIAEETIISTDGKRNTKVPIRYLDQYHFKHGFPKDGAGHGAGKPGDVLRPGKKQEDGNGDKAGKERGSDIYDAEVSIEELVNMMIEDLDLPNLEDKNKREIITKHASFTDVRKKGIMSNWSKKRTIVENIKRNAIESGEAKFKNIKEEDMRFRTWEERIERHSNAVIYMMMDRSGSMDDHKKYLCKAFFWWVVQFLDRKYDNVETVFVAHDTEAKIVPEKDFFLLSNDGGTLCSSAYELVRKDIKDHRPADIWNVYCFHFSDGDNQSDDNAVCAKIINELLPRINMFAYGEVAHENSNWQADNGMYKELSQINNPKMMTAVMRRKTDISTTLKKFLKRDANVFDGKKSGVESVQEAEV